MSIKQTLEVQRPFFSPVGLLLTTIFYIWLVRTTPTLLRPFAHHLVGNMDIVAHLLVTISTTQILRFIIIQNWLVVSTHLKNIRQNGNLPQIGVKIKNVWNHHLEKEWITIFLMVACQPTSRPKLGKPQASPKTWWFSIHQWKMIGFRLDDDSKSLLYNENYPLVN